MAGCLRNRFADTRLLAWTGPNQAVTSPPSTPLKVTGVGLYCTLFRRDAWDSIAWRAGVGVNERLPYYDWAAMHDLIAAGESVYLIGSVRCGHWQKDESCLRI